MTADAYLQQSLARETVDTGPYSPVRGIVAQLMPTLREWGGQYIRNVQPSGSFAKGTANRSGTNIDLFVSLSETINDPMQQTYESLFNNMREKGYQAKKRNVSINVNVGEYTVDLVPAKRQNSYNEDHTLYRRRANTWAKTNVTTHINHVLRSGCAQEIRIIKLWRHQKELDFPSFYLELTVIEALARTTGTLSQRVWKVFQHLRDTLPNARVVDPANTDNIVSDDLIAAERARIGTAAAQALNAKDWNEIVR